MKVTEKAYGKINFALNVGKSEKGYHKLETLVSTVDLFDKIKLYKRKDNLVTVKAGGSVKEYAYNLVPEEDNCYKTAVKFMEKYKTTGVDIVVEKHIPLCSGMGGSSACISAVLRGMKKLYDVKDSMEDLANSLGSDTNFLLKGGFAILRGRGEKVKYLKKLPKKQILAVFPMGGVSTTECFKVFDMVGYKEKPADIKKLARSLYGDDVSFSECKNMLEPSAYLINGEVKRAVDELKKLNPSAVFMTGSGSTVCAMFEYDGLCLWAQDKMAERGFKSMCIKTI